MYCYDYRIFHSAYTILTIQLASEEHPKEALKRSEIVLLHFTAYITSAPNWAGWHMIKTETNSAGHGTIVE